MEARIRTPIQRVNNFEIGSSLWARGGFKSRPLRHISRGVNQSLQMNQAPDWSG
jgi:hypothetical protein